MSGSTSDLTWASVNYGPSTPTTQWQLFNDALEFNPGIYALAFRLDATSAVPEPSTWAMMMLGFASLGFMAYRRKDKLPLSAA